MDKKIDAESQALWDELRGTKPERFHTGGFVDMASTNKMPMKPCCAVIYNLINLGYNRIWFDNVTIPIIHCPTCGRKL